MTQVPATASVTDATDNAGRLLLARGQRGRGELADARATLDMLAADQPGSATVALELAEVLALLGEHDAVILALRRVVAADPSHAGCWTALGDALDGRGDAAGANRAYLAAVDASRDDPLLREAALALIDDRLADAEPLLRARLRARPTDIAAMRMLAEIAGRIGRYGDAETLLARALALAPGFIAARHNLSLVLHRQGRGRDALVALAPLRTAEPHNPSYLNLEAAILTRMGEDVRATALYRRSLAGVPDQPKVWMSLGHSLKTLGEQAEAIAAYRRALALQPRLGEAWWSLANLKTMRFDPQDVATMRSALADPALDEEGRFHLNFALGKAAEDAGDTDTAFAAYVEGNRGRRAVLDFDSARFTARVDANRSFYTEAFFAEREGWGCPDPDPVFIVSLPRAGSTLIEQILASHSAIEGTAELHDIGAMVARRSHDDISRLGRDEVRMLGTEYLERTRIHRKTGRPLFIDKMPNNWLHAAFIRLILPRATIIDARRHPLACCWSNFKQHFARGQEFSYDLDELARYYRDYAAWMAHIDRVLPGHVHRVFYEDMVGDQEGVTRRLLDRIGVPFETACTTFYRTRRPVATASSEQVRRPIFRDGLDQWKPFEARLEPVRSILGEIVARYPVVPANL